MKADEVAQAAVRSDEIANESATGTDVLNNSLKGVDIDESSLSLSLGNADTLDSFNANELLRVAQLREEDLTPPGNAVFNPEASVDITAPKRGFVLVIANMTAENAGQCEPCFAHARLREPSSGFTSSVQISQLHNFFAASDSITVTHLFPVLAGGAGTHTYLLEGAAVPVDTDVAIQFRNPTIAALFVPFDGTGAQGP